MRRLQCASQLIFDWGPIACCCPHTSLILQVSDINHPAIVNFDVQTKLTGRELDQSSRSVKNELARSKCHNVRKEPATCKCRLGPYGRHRSNSGAPHENFECP